MVKGLDSHGGKVIKQYTCIIIEVRHILSIETCQHVHAC